MSPSTLPVIHTSGGTSNRNLGQDTVQLLQVVWWYRKPMLLAIAVAVVLGGLYYAMAPRFYEAEARLQFPTNPTAYRDVIASDTILNEALATLPAEGQREFAGIPMHKRAKALRAKLEVLVIRKTNSLKISYRSKNPSAALKVVENVLAAYFRFRDDLYQSTPRGMLELFTQEEARLEKELSAKEREMLALRQELGDVIVCQGESYATAVQKAFEDDCELLRKAHEARLAVESQLRAVESMIEKGEDLSLGLQVLLAARANEKPSSSEQEDALPPALARELAENARLVEQALGDVRLEAAGKEASSRQEELAATMQRLLRQRHQLAVEYEKLVGASCDEKRQRAVDVQQAMARFDAGNRALERLNSSFDVVSTAIKRLKGEGSSAGAVNDLLNVTIISEPELPREPVTPALPMVALVTSFLGVGGGLASVFLIDRFSRRFRSIGEMKLQLDGLSPLAAIGHLATTDEGGLGSVHAFVQPKDAITEEFNVLGSHLGLADEDVRTVAIASSEAGDGKTTVAVNLAVALAQGGKRTLLIDTDIARSRLTRLLGLRGRAGLSTLLRRPSLGAGAVAEYLCPALIPNLDAIPAGPRAVDTAQLLAGGRFSELLAWAETDYDCVLIDSPSTFGSEVAVIGRLVDGMLLVVRPDKSDRREVIRTVARLAALDVNLLGLVLNDVTIGWQGARGGDGCADGGHRYDDQTIGEEKTSAQHATGALPRVRRSA